MANSLMFEVGIKRANDEYDKIKQEIEALVAAGNKLNFKVTLEKTNELDAFVRTLSEFGSGKQLQPLIDKIERLQDRMAALSDKGKYMDFAKAEVQAATRALEQYEKRFDEIRNAPYTMNKRYWDQEKQNREAEINKIKSSSEYILAVERLAHANDILTNATERHSQEEQKSAAALQEKKSKIESLSESVATLNEKLGNGKINLNIGGEFKTWTEQVQALVAQVKELANTLQKITTPEGLKTFTESAQTTLSRLREEAEKTVNTFGKFSERADAFKRIQDSVGGGVWFGANGKQIEEIEYSKALIRILNDEKTLQKELNELRAKYSQTSLTDGKLSDFKTLERAYTEQINLLRRVNEEKTKSSSTTGKAAQSDALDPSKYSALETAINKIIEEINRLQRAFTHLGENSSLSNLTTYISGLAVTLSTLSNAIKLQPVDEQVKTLLDRCEKLEQKLKEIGEASKYANVRNGDKTQEKIADIQKLAGVAKEANAEQEALTAKQIQQYAILQSRIEKIIASLSNLRASTNGAYYGSQLDEAINKYRMVSTGAKLGVEFNLGNEHIDTLIRNLTLLDQQYANVNKGAQEFNKTQDSVNKKINQAAKALDNKIDRLEARKLVDFAGLDTNKLDDAINKIRAIRNELANFAKTGTSSSGGSASDIMKTMGLEVANREAAAAMRTLNQEKSKGASVTSQLSSEEQKLAQALGHSSHEMKSQSQILGDLKMMATQYLSVWGATSFFNNIREIGGQLEQQRLSIGAILGDMAAGQHLFDQIKSLALTSPFGVMELDKDTKQLAAYGFKQSELFDMTKRLADISAGAGTEVSRLALALGHVRSEGALTGYTLRQFAMNNIPMLAKLSERLTEIEGKIVSTSEIRKRVSKKEIGYEDVIAVIKDLTNESGMFYNMQETMAEAVNAKFKNLKDSLDIMYGEMAEGKIGSGMKLLAESLMSLSRNWESTMRIAAYATAGFLAYKAAVAGANTQLLTFGRTTITSKMALDAKKIALNLNSASVKKLTAAEIDQMVALKLVTRDQLLNAVAARKLTVDQAELAAATFNVSRAELTAIASSGKMGIAFAGLGLRLNSVILSIRGVGAALKSMFLNPVGIAMLGLTAFTELLMRSKQKSDELKESIDKMQNKSSEGYKNLADSLNKYANRDSNLSESEYKTSIDDIIDTLKNYAPDVNNIMKEAYAIEDLAGRYKYLRDQLKLTKQAYADLGKVSGSAAIANSETGLGDEVEDYIEKLKKVQKAEQDFYKHRADIDEALNKMDKYPGFRSARRNNDGSLKTVAQQIELIEGNSGWRSAFQNAIRNESTNAYGFWAKFNDEMQGSKRILEEDVTPAIEKFADRINSDFSAKFGDDWKKSGDHVKAAWIEVSEELGKVPGMTDEVRKDLLNKIFNERWHLNIDFNVGETEEKLSGWRAEMQAWLDENHLGIKIDFNDSHEDVIKKAKTMHETAQTAMNNAGNVLIGIGFKLNNLPSTLPSPLNTPWNQSNLDTYNENKTTEDLIEKFKKRFNIKWDEKNKNKNKGGSKEDKELKAARTRLEETKAFLQEYKKYREVYGDERSIDILESLFPTTKGRGDKIVKNYKEELLKIKKSLNLSTEERKKFGISIDKLIADTNLDDAKKRIDRDVQELSQYVFESAEKYNLYKSLFQKTGNKDFAMQAFGNGMIWNSLSRQFADDLRLAVEEAGVQMPSNVWGMTDAAAKEYFKGVQGGYDLWKKVVELLKGEYTDSLNKIADSTATLLTTEEKIKKAEEEMAELRKKTDNSGNRLYGDNSVVIMQKEKELQKLKNEAFEQSEPYIRFYTGIMSMTIEEAERAGNAIRKNLTEQLANAEISGDKYIKSIKRIDEQLQKLRNKKSALELMRSGGIQALAQQRVEIAEDKVSAAAQRVVEAEKKLQEARKNASDGIVGAEHAALASALLRARIEKTMSEEELKKYEAELNNAQQGLKLSQSASDTMSTISFVLQQWSSAFQEWERLAEKEDPDKTWMSSGWSGMFGAFGKVSEGISKFQSGDIAGGLMTAVFGSIDSFNEAYDKNKAKDQARAQKLIDAFSEFSNRLDRSLDRALGGVYEFKASADELKKLKVYEGSASDDFKKAISEIRSEDTGEAIKKALETESYYDAQLASLYIQRDELQRQLEDEEAKKYKDSNKVKDYENQIEELKDKIEYFAMDMAKALYSIDVKSWASEFGDALFEAWQKGENGAEAFKKKAREILADLSKNIVIKSVIEKSLEPVTQTIVTEMERTSGALDTQSVESISKAFATISNTLPNAVNTVLDAMDTATKRSGLGSIKNPSTSSTSSKLIQGGFTENETGLLLSYVNAIHADVSVDREIRTRIAEEYWPSQIAAMTSANASLINIEGKMDTIISLMNGYSSDISGIYEILTDASTLSGRGLYVRAYAAS